MSNLIVVTQKPNRVKTAMKLGAAAVTYAVAQSAFAATEIDNLATTATDYLDAAKTSALAVFAVGIILVGIFKGYSKMKQGINRA